MNFFQEIIEVYFRNRCYNAKKEAISKYLKYVQTKHGILIVFKCHSHLLFTEMLNLMFGAAVAV